MAWRAARVLFCFIILLSTVPLAKAYAVPAGTSFSHIETTFWGGPKNILYLRVLRNTFGDAFLGWTEEEIADDFRDSEEEGMQLMGVHTGMYSFISLDRGQERRSGRTLHSMKMTTRGGRGVEWRLHRQELYLLFPTDFSETKEFYMFLIGHFCFPKSCKQADLSIDSLLPVLDRFRLKD